MSLFMNCGLNRNGIGDDGMEAQLSQRASPAHTHAYWRRLSASALPAAVSVAAYLNGLHGEFLDDDPLAIVSNPDVRLAFWDNRLWHHDFWGTPLNSSASHLSYRPLTILSFRLQHAVVGFDQQSFHSVNVVLHALMCMLLMDIITPYIPHRSQRQLVGLLFGLHAVHVECVTNVVGRAELLSGCLFCCSIMCHRRAQQTALATAVALGWLIGCLGLAGLSMLCKEGGLTALLVCGVIGCDTQFHRTSTQLGGEARWCHFGLLLTLLLLGAWTLLLLRLWINGWRSPTFTSADNSAAFCPEWTCRLLSYSYLYWLNLRLLLLPSHLAHDWSMTTIPNLHDARDPRLPLALVPYAVLVLLAAWVVRSLLHPSTAGRAALGPLVGTSLLLLPFLPSAHIFLTVGFTLAERVLYLPSAGFCVLLTLLLPHLPRAAGRTARVFKYGIPALLFGMHAVLTLRRNVDWRTNLSLLTSGVAHQPTNSKLQYNLGYVLLNELQPPRTAEAIHHLRAATALLPTMLESRVVEGAALRSTGRLTESEYALRTAVRLPSVAAGAPAAVYYAHIGLAQTLRAAGKEVEALSAFLPAINANPAAITVALEAATLAGDLQARIQTRATGHGLGEMNEVHTVQMQLLRHVLRLQPANYAASAQFAKARAMETPVAPPTARKAVTWPISRAKPREGSPNDGNTPADRLHRERLAHGPAITNAVRTAGQQRWARRLAG